MEKIHIPFKDIVIICDGEHTQLIVDGEPWGKLTSKLVFVHRPPEAPYVEIEKPVRLSAR